MSSSLINFFMEASNFGFLMGQVTNVNVTTDGHIGRFFSFVTDVGCTAQLSQTSQMEITPHAGHEENQARPYLEVEIVMGALEAGQICPLVQQ